jgi:hypothetical protein
MNFFDLCGERKGSSYRDFREEKSMVGLEILVLLFG